MSKVPGIYLNGQEDPGGTIGVIASDLGRYTDFMSAMCVLQKPWNARLIVTKSVDVVGNCNTICRNLHGDWLWLMGDDHVFNPDILVNLLEHDVDIVVPYCLTRTPPYAPVVYERQNEKNEYVMAKLPEHGLHQIHAAGSAGMLIRRHVIDAIDDPWFESYGGLNEDLTFCAKARDAGFEIFCDVDQRMGHISPHTVWPDYRDDGWHPNLVLSPQVVVPLRSLERLPEEELV